MIKATELTSKSWILSKSTEKMGLLRESTEGIYSIMGGPYNGKNGSLEEIEEEFKQQLKFVKPEKPKEEKEAIFIEGFPIKHDTIFPLQSDGDLHTYTKKEGSVDYYIAGYFCVQFRGKWQSSYCPRAKTLDEHPWMGPFKTKLEMDHIIRVENNK